EGTYEESLTYLIEACNRSHNDDGDWRKTCFVMLADTLMKLNRYEDSLAIIKDAEEVWSYIPDFPMLKAIIYFHQSLFDDTKDICYQVVDAMHMYISPIHIPSCKDAIPYELLGDIYMREQDYQNAITHYIHALGYAYAYSLIWKIVSLLLKFHTEKEVFVFIKNNNIIRVDNACIVLIQQLQEKGFFELANSLVELLVNKDQRILNSIKVKESILSIPEEITQYTTLFTKDELYTAIEDGFVNISDLCILYFD